MQRPNDDLSLQMPGALPAATHHEDNATGIAACYALTPGGCHGFLEPGTWTHSAFKAMDGLHAKIC